MRSLQRPVAAVKSTNLDVQPTSHVDSESAVSWKDFLARPNAEARSYASTGVAEEMVSVEPTILHEKIVICPLPDCEQRVCQLGESCETGQCSRIAGRFCTWAPRDCGPAFACKDNACVDLLTPATTVLPQQDNKLPN
ncbi:unnamed protein product [Heligmosomoides polygyrus]|uniref:EB domain-containing protein n=1 Tax=Heligmosomoides polygyrus TaxID=6339 RepID=A0A183FU64_HELPZ|nr:unnamed protein product [Heligmosomoides polygyrus]